MVEWFKVDLASKETIVQILRADSDINVPIYTFGHGNRNELFIIR